VNVEATGKEKIVIEVVDCKNRTLKSLIQKTQVKKYFI
jgi:hypothetical protein